MVIQSKLEYRNRLVCFGIYVMCTRLLSTDSKKPIIENFWTRNVLWMLTRSISSVMCGLSVATWITRKRKTSTFTNKNRNRSQAHLKALKIANFSGSLRKPERPLEDLAEARNTFLFTLNHATKLKPLIKKKEKKMCPWFQNGTI